MWRIFTTQISSHFISNVIDIETKLSFIDAFSTTIGTISLSPFLFKFKKKNSFISLPAGGALNLWGSFPKPDHPPLSFFLELALTKDGSGSTFLTLLWSRSWAALNTSCILPHFQTLPKMPWQNIYDVIITFYDLLGFFHVHKVTIFHLSKIINVWNWF